MVILQVTCKAMADCSTFFVATVIKIIMLPLTKITSRIIITTNSPKKSIRSKLHGKIAHDSISPITTKSVLQFLFQLIETRKCISCATLVDAIPLILLDPKVVIYSTILAGAIASRKSVTITLDISPTSSFIWSRHEYD